MREPILSNDNQHNENNNKPICEAKYRKIIAGVNGIYTEILIGISVELSVVSCKIISNLLSLNSHREYFLIIHHYKTAVNTKEIINKYDNVNKGEWNWETPCVVVDNLIYDVIIETGQIHEFQCVQVSIYNGMQRKN